MPPAIDSALVKMKKLGRWRATKAGILAGLAFAASIELIAIPIAYFIDRLAEGFLLSAVAGAIFGIAIGLVVYDNGKRLESRIDLCNGEHLIHHQGANLVDGRRVVGGRLFLTDQRLLFDPNGVNIDNHPWERALSDIECVTPSSIYGVLPVCISVTTVFDDQGIQFVVENRKRWKQELDSAIAALPKQKTWAEMYYLQPACSAVTADQYILEHGAFPLPDRSHIQRNTRLASGQIDFGWGRGVINDGQHDRPFFTETWAEAGHITNQTIFFSRIGLEALSAQHVLENFRANGLIECTTEPPCELIRLEDRNGHPLWSFNLCLGAGDIIYASKSLPYQAYRSVISACSHCIVCGSEDIVPVAAFDGRGVPHGQANHNFVHDYKEISVCRSCQSAQMEVHSHDCWPHDEPWDMYWWYALPPSDVRAIQNIHPHSCNTPLVSGCDCAWHQVLSACFKVESAGATYAPAGDKAKHFCWLKVRFSEAGWKAETDHSNGMQAVATRRTEYAPDGGAPSKHPD